MPHVPCPPLSRLCPVAQSIAPVGEHWNWGGGREGTPEPPKQHTGRGPSAIGLAPTPRLPFRAGRRVGGLKMMGDGSVCSRALSSFFRTLVGCCSGVDLLGLQGNKRHHPSPLSCEHLVVAKVGSWLAFICSCRQHAPRSHSHSCLEIKPELSFLVHRLCLDKPRPLQPSRQEQAGIQCIVGLAEQEQPTDNLPLPMRPNSGNVLRGIVAVPQSCHRGIHAASCTHPPSRVLTPPESRHPPSRLARPPALHG